MPYTERRAGYQTAHAVNRLQSTVCSLRYLSARPPQADPARNLMQLRLHQPRRAVFNYPETSTPTGTTHDDT